MSPRLLALPFVAALVLFASACSDDESVFNAEVGECIQDPGDGGVGNFDEVSCTEDHYGEIYFLFDHEGDDDEFPGRDELNVEASEECAGAFEDYVGEPYGTVSLDVTIVSPTEETWSDGDRETICIAYLPDGELDQSVEGNGEDYLLGDDGGGDDSTSTTVSVPPVDFDPDIEGLIEDCEGGDMAACDELYIVTDSGSPEEEIGATCGGRSPEPIPTQCVATYG